MPVYETFMMSESRYCLLYGGAGAGKSVAAAHKVLLRCLTEDGAKILVCRKVKASLRESCFALLKSLVRQMEIEDSVQVLVSRLALVFENGSEIFCTGLDDVEKLKSIQGITSVWVEEATELAAEDFAQLELRVRGKTVGYKQFVLTFNPVDQGGWLYGRFFGCEMPDAGCQKGEGALKRLEKEDVLIVHATAADNLMIDDAYREHLDERLRGDANLHRIYSLGLWGHVRREGVFYKQFSIGRHVGEAVYNPRVPLHFSFDFNLHPYMTCTVWQVVGNQLRQIDELCLESPQNSTVEMGRELAKRYAKHRAGCRLYGDPGGYQIGTHGTANARYRHSHYELLTMALAGLHPEVRAAKSAPPVAQRGIFLNALLGDGVEGLEVQIAPHCRHTLDDYQHLQEAPDGSKHKAMYTHPRTGIRCQQYGHTSDANDYFLCEVLKDMYKAHFTLPPYLSPPESPTPAPGSLHAFLLGR